MALGHFIRVSDPWDERVAVSWDACPGAGVVSIQPQGWAGHGGWFTSLLGSSFPVGVYGWTMSEPFTLLHVYDTTGTRVDPQKV